MHDMSVPEHWHFPPDPGQRPVVAPIKMYSAELETLLHLYRRGQSSAADIHRSSMYSSPTFYNGLRRLVQEDLLECEKDSQDRRSILYALSDKCQAILDEGFRYLYTEFSRTQPGDLGERIKACHAFLKRMENKLSVRYCSYEYCILIYLFYNRDVCAYQIQRAFPTSQSSFFNTVKRMRSIHLLSTRPGTRDRRTVVYNLETRAFDLMTEKSESTYLWLKERFARH